MSEWQPIETAPKDGEHILLCEYAVFEPLIFSSWWHDLNEPPGWTHGLDNDPLPAPFAPTHWMPLPEPPAIGDLSEAELKDYVGDEVSELLASARAMAREHFFEVDARNLKAVIYEEFAKVAADHQK